MGSVRLGQMTIWDRDNGYALGAGMVDFKCLKEASETLVGITRIAALEFDAPPRPKKKGLFSRLFG
jgi:hypothetical protein